MTKIRHDVMLRLVKVLDVVMITLPFAACWVWYYAAKTPMDGTWQGHAVILGLYAVLFILLGKTYDAFWMSMLRLQKCRKTRRCSKKVFPRLSPRLKS